MQNLWDIIKNIRKKAGLNQKEFAQRIGCSEQHISFIERPYDETRRTASEKLLMAIAKEFSSSEEERVKLERDLMIARAKLLIAKEIRSPMLVAEILSDVMKESMPNEFIERVKKDIKNWTDAGKEPIEDMYLIEVLEGSRVLSRSSVISLANRLNQPVDEYLSLANYITSEIKSVTQVNEIKKLIQILSQMSREQLQNAAKMLLAFIKTYANKQ